MENIITKRCAKCGKEKPRSEFWKDTKTIDGLQHWCKDCGREYRLHPHRKIAEMYRFENDILVARRCTRCKKMKPVSEFSKRLSNKYGLRESCKACQPRDTKLRQGRYISGFKPEVYYKLLEQQNKKCAICGGDGGGRVLNLDHDHETGKVRGLLCHHCNIALGNFRDNISSLISAAKYLMKSRTLTTEYRKE